METFVYLEKTDETVTSYREVGKPALYLLDQRREECHIDIYLSYAQSFQAVNVLFFPHPDLNYAEISDSDMEKIPR